jgi:hypothetical protein
VAGVLLDSLAVTNKMAAVEQWAAKTARTLMSGSSQEVQVHKAHTSELAANTIVGARISSEGSRGVGRWYHACKNVNVLVASCLQQICEVTATSLGF